MCVTYVHCIDSVNHVYKKTILFLRPLGFDGRIDIESNLI